MEEERGILQKILVFFISFFLGLFLFLSSFLFLYQNEAIKIDLFKQEIINKTQKQNLFSNSKILTFRFKELFVDNEMKDIQSPTLILRGIGFFVMWFGFTLFLISFKKSTSGVGIFSLLFCLFLFILTLFISNFILFLESGKNLINTSGNIIGTGSNNIANIFSKEFLENLLGFKIDTYFLYFLLFLLAVVLYIFFPKIKEKINSKLPKKEEKSSFKKYGK